MKTDLDAGLHTLRQHALMRIQGRQGRTLVLFSGEVWLTQEGDRADHVLSAGESFALERPGVAIVQALVDTRFIVIGNQVDAGTVVPALMDAQALHRQALRMRTAEWHRLGAAAASWLRGFWKRSVARIAG
jgi:Protein of unknown function (DUF2917)